MACQLLVGWSGRCRFRHTGHPTEICGGAATSDAAPRFFTERLQPPASRSGASRLNYSSRDQNVSHTPSTHQDQGRCDLVRTRSHKTRTRWSRHNPGGDCDGTLGRHCLLRCSEEVGGGDAADRWPSLVWMSVVTILCNSKLYDALASALAAKLLEIRGAQSKWHKCGKCRAHAICLQRNKEFQRFCGQGRVQRSLRDATSN